MSSKNPKTPDILIIGLFSAIIIAGLDKTLTLYIHPRYSLFAILMSVIAVGVLLIDIFSTNKKTAHEHGKKYHNYLIALALLFMVVLAPRQLSASLAGNRQRIENTNNTVTSTIFDNFSGDLTRFTIKDWAGALNSASKNQVIGKKARISGFVTKDSSNDRFLLSRYQLTCCAVDARPISLYVEPQEAGWQDRYTVGQWLEIEGVFNDIDGTAVLIPTSIKLIDQPKEPYVN